jgi:hypothetical protein
MKINLILPATVVAAATLPSIASATDTSALSAACGRAFAAKLGLANSDAPTYKLTDLVGGDAQALERFSGREYSISMVARAPKSGTPVAKATCLVTSDGSVISVKSQVLRVVDTRSEAR